MPRRRELSLRRQLLMWLLLPQLVLWLAAAFLAYNMALAYTNEVIDRTLAKSSSALARQVKPFGNGFYVDFPSAARDILQQDPDDRVHYMVSSPPEAFLLGEPAMPRPPVGTPAKAGDSFFYNARMKGKEVRVAAQYLTAGTAERPQLMLVQVAKSRALNAELARKILVDMGLPLLGMMLLTSVLVWAGISRGLSPLRSLRRRVEDRSARDLAPIEVDNAPNEVRSLTAAINALLGEVHGQVAQQRRFIADAAHPSVARSIRLVNQLLALARAEPEAGLNLLPLDFAQLVRDVTAEAVPRALTARIDLGLEADAGTMVVSGHAGLLRELLANLLDNAVQYTPAGGEVTVLLQRRGKKVQLTVRDNGPGIPLAERERVFERFYRGSAEGKGKGCGLGLAIVQEIARRHDSSLQLTDTPGGGLSAVLELALLPD